MIEFVNMNISKLAIENELKQYFTSFTQKHQNCFKKELGI